MKKTYIKFYIPILIVLLGLIAYLTYSIYDRSMESTVTVEKITSNIEKIAYYDEVLTMSARMAVFTGDKKWVERYNEFSPKLDHIISESIDIVPKINTFLEKVDSVNKELISMETLSFKYLDQDKIEQSKNILFSQKYLTNKKLYNNGINSIISELRQHRNDFRSEIEKEFLLAIVIIIFLLILSIFFGKQIISYLKDTNDKLQDTVLESELELKNLYTLSPLGIALTDINGKYVKFNEAFEKICGYDKEELNTLDYWELTPKKYEANEAKQLELLSSTGFYGPYEKEYIQKDGTHIDIRLNGMLITDSNNQQFIWSIVEDISDQKSILKQSESIAKIIDDSLNEVYIFDAETLLFTYINKGAEKNIGYSLSEMVGMTAYDIKPDIDKKTFHKIIEPLVNNTKEILIFETVHQRKDGSLYNVEVHLQLTTYKGQKQFVAIILDTSLRNTLMSDNERLESMVEARTQALKEATSYAENANKAKSEFLANMSHEIRTPMNGVLGFVEQLTKSETDPKKLEKLDVIKTSSDQLLHIINDILDLSKIESGKLEMEKHPLQIKELLKNSSDIFSQEASKKDITYDYVSNDSLPDTILGDETRIKQVIFNLLSNAIKFSPPKGKVSLRSSYDSQSGYLTVSVEDNGMGIAESKLEKIFNAFEQEDSSTTRRFGGSGLGLAISSKLIALMGGDLKVESELGKGSKFFFVIPVETAKEIAAKEPVNQENDLKAPLSGNILVVEDNKTNQMLLGMILDDLGLSYEVANDGIEAVSCFQNNKYDVILMDENMPNMNGVEATKHIREMEKSQSLKTTPIVAVTANALSTDRERFLNAGMDDYISKPFTESAITKVLVKFLESDRSNT